MKLSLVVVGKDIQQAEEFPMNAPGRGYNRGEEGAAHFLGRIARPIFFNLLLCPVACCCQSLVDSDESFQLVI